ncbi:winged helix-turn-helix transcriptional regulator [Sphaerisporangium fuscum]|uniref:winged helix-turn-helix transcriptional regulator n=1 Tax=Sphaerisporangium fuscum TaxID=2835868 RepID=UPI0027E33F26|nr:helix-turn-helix domain-containing protein [Sphaerisporangium fuscum]
MREWNQVSEWTSGQSGEVPHTDCPVRKVLDHVTSRWGVWVLMALAGGDLRFHELRGRIPGVSEKMLSQTLRTLVRDGLVWRAVEPATPPRVTYGLTPLGRGAGEPMATLLGWIRDHAGDILATQSEYDRACAK